MPPSLIVDFFFVILGSASMTQEESADDVLARDAERKRALAAQLSERPIEDVIGLVDPSGRAGWPEHGNQWTLSFSFHSWRIPPGPMKTRPLSVRLTSSRQDHDELWELVPSYSVVRIRARVVEESVFGTSEAQLVEYLGLASDAELVQAAIDLKKPVIQWDPQFGELTLDRRINWYTVETEWNGATIVLNVHVDHSGDTEAALQVARTLWKNQEQWKARIEDCAVQELLSLKSDNWLEEGEAELTADQFKARLELDSITVDHDGSFDFWHNDGDMFWGHAIEVGGSLSEGLTHAHISG